MVVHVRVVGQFATFIMLASVVSCCSWKSPPVESGMVYPTAPATLPEVIDALSGYSAAARVTAAYALPRFGEEAIVAIPALVQNLHYDNSDVREAAAFALGELGPEARDAVPNLISVLQTDDSVNARKSAAEALGKIGDPSSVLALADSLYAENQMIAILSAKSISLITRENFPDADSQSGYRLNVAGVPLIVVAAQEWWENEGQFQDWGEKAIDDYP